jgi:peptidoglycan/LPS O-acetylase OafA/YrhL
MQRLDPLTGLRGIAAYSVLFAHAIDTAFVYVVLLAVIVVGFFYVTR